MSSSCAEARSAHGDRLIKPELSGQSSIVRNWFCLHITLYCRVFLSIKTMFLPFISGFFVKLKSLRYPFHMKAVTLTRVSFALQGDLIKRFLPLGLTSLFSQISLAAAMAAINNMIRKYGAMDPVFGLLINPPP